jgi:hypothetical protein
VNSVRVTNRSGKPLLLVGGEMILGGQQDRIIGRDQLVPPHSTAVVSVFCVEHGRWSGAGHFGAAGGIVDSDVRARAMVAQDQQQVWDEVAQKAARLKAPTPTGTYRAVDEKAKTSIRPGREAIAAELGKRSDVVGLAAAIDGRVVSVDVFATPELLAQYRDRILDAALIEAQSLEAKPAAAPPTPAAVQSFLDRARADRTSNVVRGAGGAAVVESAVSHH